MKLIRLAIEHPIPFLMIALGITVLGVISWVKAPVSYLPDIQFPAIYIYITYTNLDIDYVKENIVKPVEHEISQIYKAKSITTRIYATYCIIWVEFDYGTKVEVISSHLQNQLTYISKNFPANVNFIISTADLSYLNQYMSLHITGSLKQEQKYMIAETIIKPALAKIKGISNVNISQSRRRKALILLDPLKLKSYELTIPEIIRQLRNYNDNGSLGKIRLNSVNYNVLARSEVDSLSRYSEAIIAYRGNTPIYLRDVGEISEPRALLRSRFHIDGNPVVGITITAEERANILKLSKNIREELSQINRRLPANAKVEVTYDNALALKETILRIKILAALGVIFAFVILLIFTSDIRPVMTILIAIPLSLLAAVNLIYFLDISLNIVSLCGLAIGIGMLIDNSIVVLDNILRHPGKNYNRKEKVYSGTAEVYRAIAASTITTVIIFVPILFLSDEIRVLFSQGALTIVSSLIASFLVAITIIPMLANKLRLKEKSSIKGNKRIFNIPKLREKYVKILKFCIHERYSLLILIIAITLLSYWYIFPSIPYKNIYESAELDKIDLLLNLPKGIELKMIEEATSEVERRLLSLPYRQKLYSWINQDGVQIEMILKREFRRSNKIAKIKQEIQNKLSSIPLGTISFGQLFAEGSQIETGKHDVINFKLYAADEAIIKETYNYLSSILKDEKANIHSLEYDLGKTKRIIMLDLDFYKITRIYPNHYELNQIVQSSLSGGFLIDRLKEKGEIINVYLQLKNYDSDETAKLAELLSTRILQASGENDFQLSNIVSRKDKFTPYFLSRKNGLIESAGSMKLKPQNSLKLFKEKQNRIKSLLKNTSLQKGAIIEFTAGEAISDEDKKLAIYIAIGILIAIYLVTASLYESLLRPLLLFIHMPLTLIGVVWALKLTGNYWNYLSFLGVFLLFGISVNNGILLLDFINRLRRKGYSLHYAVLKSCSQRFRPIAITTLTTILGVLPLTFPLEESDVWVGFAIAIVGGLALSTILVLLCMPIFLFIGRDLKELRRTKKQKDSKIKTIKKNIESGSLQIKVTNLTKIYDGRIIALKGIDLEINQGIFGLLGPNGAGKTTLMRIIATILNPTRGSVYLNGEKISARGKEILPYIGYLPQFFNAYYELTALQFLELWALSKQMNGKKIRRASLEKTLELVGLWENRNEKVDSFSGGMKKRLGIAQALIGEPKILIIDEPTTGLDPEFRVKFRNLLTYLSEKKLIIFSTHLVEDISQTCKRLAVLYNGGILFDGEVRDLIKRAKGKIYQATLEFEEFINLKKRSKIVTSMRTLQGIKTRFIDVNRPTIEAVAAKPTLEEAYITIIEECSQSDKKIFY